MSFFNCELSGEYCKVVIESGVEYSVGVQSVATKAMRFVNSKCYAVVYSASDHLVKIIQ